MTRWERERRLQALGITKVAGPPPGVPADPVAGETGWTVWVLVDSSNVAEIRWHQDHDLLQVLFKNHSTYEYAEVTWRVWKSFVDAPSKGKFVWDVLRGRHGGHIYPYRKVS